MNSNDELKAIIQDYRLSNTEIAEMTGYAIDTVKAWRASPSSQKYRPMKGRALNLLKFEIQSRKLKRKPKQQ